MKEVKSNKYKVAQEVIKDLEGVNVPETVKASEKHLYHILNITSVANKASFKFVHTVKISKFNKESFEKGKEMFNQLGYEKLVVFHDPTLPIEVEEVEEKINVLSVKDLETNIENYSLEELNEMLETETRKGAIKLIQDRIDILA